MSEEEKHGVWVIEEGEYSDYHVIGVFSTQENAQMVWDAIKKNCGRYCSLRNGPTFWELDPAINRLRAGYHWFYVKMLRDGTVTSCTVSPPPTTTDNIDPYFDSPHFYVSRPSQFRSNSGPDYLDASLWAKDEQQAIKATNEQRAMMIANGKWD